MLSKLTTIQVINLAHLVKLGFPGGSGDHNLNEVPEPPAQWSSDRNVERSLILGLRLLISTYARAALSRQILIAGEPGTKHGACPAA